MECSFTGASCETQSDQRLLAAVFPMCHSAASWLAVNLSDLIRVGQTVVTVMCAQPR